VPWVDDTGPAGSLIALEAAGIKVTRLTTRARAAADGGFFEAVPGSTDAL
jgi:hypothetical protein